MGCGCGDATSGGSATMSPELVASFVDALDEGSTFTVGVLEGRPVLIGEPSEDVPGAAYRYLVERFGAAVEFRFTVGHDAQVAMQVQVAGRVTREAHGQVMPAPSEEAPSGILWDTRGARWGCHNDCFYGCLNDQCGSCNGALGCVFWCTLRCHFRCC